MACCEVSGHLIAGLKHIVFCFVSHLFASHCFEHTQTLGGVNCLKLEHRDDQIQIEDDWKWKEHHVLRCDDDRPDTRYTCCPISGHYKSVF